MVKITEEEYRPYAYPKPDNGSGYGHGMYASPADTDVYLRALDGWLAKRNAAWLDRWQGRNGTTPDGVRDFLNRWQADNHLVKWAVETGRLDSVTMPEQKARQVGRHTAILYHRETERAALVRELNRYGREQWDRATEAVLKKHPELIEPGEEG